MNIPIFKGGANTFMEFINSFKSTIDQNENLSNTDKFIYFKSFVSGDAHKMMSDLTLTEENYEQSLEFLQYRYGKTEFWISGFIKTNC